MGLIFITGQSVSAQTSEGRYFKETNKWVRGEILKFYTQTPNPDLHYGFPISDELVVDGGRVQYFERGRIDIKTNAKGTQVKLANLGWMMWNGQSNPADTPEISSTCRYFPKYGKYVCFDFLKFYDKLDGNVYFGDPLTNVEYRNGGYVQYFENVRLEFRAFLPLGKQIVIADLGREAYLKYVGPLPLIPTSQNGGVIPADPVLNRPHAHAFSAFSLVPVQARQTVYVVVHDLDSKPIEAARISVLLEYPNGRKEQVVGGLLTNPDGVVIISFTVGNFNIDDIVKVNVQAEFMGDVYTAGTWFRIWY